VAVTSAKPYADHCISLQTGNHATTTSLKCFTGWMLFRVPNQQCQSTEGINGSVAFKNPYLLVVIFYGMHAVTLLQKIPHFVAGVLANSQ